MARRWWNPLHRGVGSSAWKYQCAHRLRDTHQCIERAEHGWQHTAANGLRWAA